MCPYETVALGYSSFCDLFSVEEWKAFEYRFDIMWWYGSGFGSPVARASGVGYVQELVSRLTHSKSSPFITSVISNAIGVSQNHGTQFDYQQLFPQ